MLLIDMPMPTNCLECPVCNEYLCCAIPVGGHGWGENNVSDFSKSRPEWCPMKEQEAEWVEDKQGEHCRLIKCSKCGLTFIVGNNIPYDEWIEDRNYCRRCGARMRGMVKLE